MDECIDSLGGATIFSTLEDNSRYCKVKNQEYHRDLTSFSGHFGLFRFTRMPFGLNNAPAKFQCAVDIIPSRVKWQFAFLYLDDVIIYLKCVSEHFKHVRVVLNLLSKVGITLKLENSSFSKKNFSILATLYRRTLRSIE